MTSSRRPDNWIVPGGGVEPEEEPSVTAMREVLEEAGVIGKLGRCLGVFEVRFSVYYFDRCFMSKCQSCLNTIVVNHAVIFFVKVNLK